MLISWDAHYPWDVATSLFPLSIRLSREGLSHLPKDIQGVMSGLGFMLGGSRCWILDHQVTTVCKDGAGAGEK